MSHSDVNVRAVHFLDQLSEEPQLIQQLVSPSPVVRLRAVRQICKLELKDPTCILLLLGVTAQVAHLAYNVMDNCALHLKIMKTMKQMPCLKEMISTHLCRTALENTECNELYEVRKCLMTLKARQFLNNQADASCDISFPLVYKSAASLKASAISLCNDTTCDALQAYNHLKQSYTLYRKSKRGMKYQRGSSLKFWENYGIRLARNIQANKTFLLSVIPAKIQSADHSGKDIQQAFATTVCTFLNRVFKNIGDLTIDRHRTAMIGQLVPFISGPLLLTRETFENNYVFASTIVKALVPKIGAECILCAVVCYAKNAVWLLAFLAHCECSFKTRLRALIFVGYILRPGHAANVAPGVVTVCRQMQRLLQYGLDATGSSVLSRRSDYDGRILHASYYTFNDHEDDKELQAIWDEFATSEHLQQTKAFLGMVRNRNICFPLPASRLLTNLKVRPWISKADNAERTLWLFFCICNEYGPEKKLALPIELVRIVHGFLVGAFYGVRDYTLQQSSMQQLEDRQFVY